MIFPYPNPFPTHNGNFISQRKVKKEKVLKENKNLLHGYLMNYRFRPFVILPPRPNSILPPSIPSFHTPSPSLCRGGGIACTYPDSIKPPLIHRTDRLAVPIRIGFSHPTKKSHKSVKKTPISSHLIFSSFNASSASPRENPTPKLTDPPIKHYSSNQDPRDDDDE